MVDRLSKSVEGLQEVVIAKSVHFAEEKSPSQPQQYDPERLDEYCAEVTAQSQKHPYRSAASQFYSLIKRPPKAIN